VDIPDTIASSANSPFTIQALNALQAQNPQNTASSDFRQAVEAMTALSDTLDVSSPVPDALGAVGTLPGIDPSASVLFQAHAGAFAPSAVTISQTKAVLPSAAQTQLTVAGVNAATATGAFAEGQSRPTNVFAPALQEAQSARGTRYPSVASAEDPGGAYDALMRAPGAVKPRVGTRMDLKG
jgi:hypothetical protein